MPVEMLATSLVLSSSSEQQLCAMIGYQEIEAVIDRFIAALEG